MARRALALVLIGVPAALATSACAGPTPGPARPPAVAVAVAPEIHDTPSAPSASSTEGPSPREEEAEAKRAADGPVVSRPTTLATAVAEETRDQSRPHTKAEQGRCMRACVIKATGGRVVPDARGHFEIPKDESCGTPYFTCAFRCAVRQPDGSLLAPAFGF